MLPILPSKTTLNKKDPLSRNLNLISSPLTYWVLAG